MKKIKIIGAGLSGLSAGITLAKNGYDVEIYERNKDVGRRFNGDLQGLENWSEKTDVIVDLKNMNIETDFYYTSCSEFYISDGLKKQKIVFGRPIFYLIKRGAADDSLDQALKKQALKSGAVIFFNKTISVAEADIIATGPIMNKICAMANGIVFKTKAPDIIISLINQKAAPKGYGYLLIVNGYGCLATVLFGEFEKINSCFHKIEKIISNLVQFDIVNPKKFGGIGGFSVKNIFQKENRIYIGEAAGLQDKLWGFGMRSAIKSGYLAAQSIINHQNYEKIAQKEFGKKIKASLVNRFIWEKVILKNFKVPSSTIRAPLKSLYSFYNFNFLQKIMYPFIKKD